MLKRKKTSIHIITDKYSHRAAGFDIKQNLSLIYYDGIRQIIGNHILCIPLCLFSPSCFWWYPSQKAREFSDVPFQNQNRSRPTRRRVCPVFVNCYYLLSHRIYVVATASEMPTAVRILEICMLVKYHYCNCLLYKKRCSRIGTSFPIYCLLYF